MFSKRLKPKINLEVVQRQQIMFKKNGETSLYWKMKL